MRRSEQLQGVRMLKLRDVLSRWESAQLSQLEAAELLGMSERTFRRWARRLEGRGNARRHDLLELLTIAPAASLCGAERCVDFELFARSKKPPGWRNRPDGALWR